MCFGGNYHFLVPFEMRSVKTKTAFFLKQLSKNGSSHCGLGELDEMHWIKSPNKEHSKASDLWGTKFQNQDKRKTSVLVLSVIANDDLH